MPGPPRDLLERLGYLDGDTAAAPNRGALLRAAARFRRILVLDAMDAPGLTVLGAEIDPDIPGSSVAGVSGTGLTFGNAFESCVGEGVERLSQFVGKDDRIIQTSEAAALETASPALRLLWDRLRPYRLNAAARQTTWLQAADLSDGHAVFLPADLCVRRSVNEREITPPWPLSTGCGAGKTLLDATLHGLLELIERDAVALWWRGGQRPRLVPSGTGAVRLAQLRRGEDGRRTWFLDITSDIGVPTIAAVSCQADGFGLCCGFAARPTLADAADAAMMELGQMEVAYRLAITKRSVRGDAALNATDRQHIQRFTAIAVDSTLALHPMPPPSGTSDLPAQGSISLLAMLRRRLAAVGLAPCALDLTRTAFAIPVVRVVCPGLEPGLTGPVGPRLAAAAAKSGVIPDDGPPL